MMYLDKLGRVVRVDRMASGSYCAMVRLKKYKGVYWWKAFQTGKIKPSRDPAVVQERLDAYAKANGMPWVSAVVDKSWPGFGAALKNAIEGLGLDKGGKP